jgi:S-DNA-T family DNA segregation ATPase FtsK/SpoIIIE
MASKRGRMGTRQAKQIPSAQLASHRHVTARLREVLLTITMVLCVYFFVALMTYSHTDPGWSHVSSIAEIHNAGGVVGAWFADVFLYLFGYLADAFPILVAYGAFNLYREQRDAPFSLRLFGLKMVGLMLVLVAGSALADLYLPANSDYLPFNSGGVFGTLIGAGVLGSFNAVGSTLLLTGLLLSGITMLTGLSWMKILDVVGKGVMLLLLGSYFGGKSLVKRGIEKRAQHKAMVAANAVDNAPEIATKPMPPSSASASPPPSSSPSPEKAESSARFRLNQLLWSKEVDVQRVEPVLEMDSRDHLAVASEQRKTRASFDGVESSFNFAESYDEPVARAKPKPQPAPVRPVVQEQSVLKMQQPMPAAKRAKNLGNLSVQAQGIPSLSLLDAPPTFVQKGYTHATLEAMSREVELRLHDFGVQVKVVAVHPGPVITRFEIQLAPGIKVSKITGLAKDLARSLSVLSVRVVEVIPGKSSVGIEVPNADRQTVCLSELLNSGPYQQARSPVSLALGKDIAGHPVVVDLGKMPHLLVAGTTGSGKSVGLNAMVLSLLYKAMPDQVRVIMIDPKMLELSVYEGIPHLLCPVVTDMKEAANALRWCVGEMERRYRLMATLGVRNLAGYNQKVAAGIAEGVPLKNPFVEPSHPDADLTHLPTIVVIIDEFADMMMVVGKKVEELIARIAQKARAAGIHMILATQRPSVDVITGLIKANIPTRIAFQVSSKIDSRTILDQQGAEQLLGHGDMLYLAPGTGIPVRVHGAFVSDEEVHKVVAEWRLRGEPEYLDEILEQPEITTSASDGIMGDDDPESDPLYDKAVQIVISTRRASISGVQRRLKIGYNRAARLVEAMERAGLVGSMESNGNREVLVPATADED